MHTLQALTLAALLAVTVVAVRADDKKPAPPKLPPAAEGKIDFDRDIKPVLAAKCVTCHGPFRQRGGLRLDNAAHAKDGGNTGPVIVPGKSAESKLIHALAGTDP